MLFQRLGGLQIQITETLTALRSLGVDAGLADPVRESLSKYDVLHVFSAHHGNHLILDTAKSLGIPVVLSPVLHPVWTSSLVRRADVLERIVGRLTGWMITTNYALIKGAINRAQCLVALGSSEKLALETNFGADPARVVVIPNGVSGRYFLADPDPFTKRFGFESGFVLCVAAINSRKNQLALVNALKGTATPLVLIGECLSENAAYLEALTASQDVHYLGPMAPDDPMLPSAYAAAAVTVLPSTSEVMPLTVIESLAAGTPVVMTNNHQMDLSVPVTAVREIDPSDRGGMRAAIAELQKRPLTRVETSALVGELVWENVARRLVECYQDCLREPIARRRAPESASAS
jgi:glycosyltransferase involved in cell wall biosynthesis